MESKSTLLQPGRGNRLNNAATIAQAQSLDCTASPLACSTPDFDLQENMQTKPRTDQSEIHNTSSASLNISALIDASIRTDASFNGGSLADELAALGGGGGGGGLSLADEMSGAGGGGNALSLADELTSPLSKVQNHTYALGDESLLSGVNVYSLDISGLSSVKDSPKASLSPIGGSTVLDDTRMRVEIRRVQDRLGIDNGRDGNSSNGSKQSILSANKSGDSSAIEEILAADLSQMDDESADGAHTWALDVCL